MSPSQSSMHEVSVMNTLTSDKMASSPYLHKAVHTGGIQLPAASRKLPWLQFLETNRRQLC